MYMIDEAKKICRCKKCRKSFKDEIAVFYNNEYICQYCYNHIKNDEIMKKMQDDAIDKKKKMINDMFINEEKEILNDTSTDDDGESLEESVTREKEELIDNLLQAGQDDLYRGSFFRETYEFPKKMTDIITPDKIVAELDKCVIGQDAAKRTLAVAVCNHYRRINAGIDDVRMPKSNIIMQGPTGCGKTYMLQILAKMMDVPFCIVDASTITEAGYKGNDVESVITALYQAASKDIAKTEKGIIYLDEFDKLSSRYGHGENETSVGAGVQRQLLKIIEGCELDVPKSGTRMSGNTITVNTENILFICGGAFVGLKDDKCKSMRTIGFGVQDDSYDDISKNNTSKDNVSNDNVTYTGSIHSRNQDSETSSDKLEPQDFIDYGIIPEMVGRLPVIVKLNNLSESDMADILRNSEDSLTKKYVQLFKKVYDVELVFKDAAIDEIAHQAYIRKTGARGLMAIIENIMQDLLYDIPSDTSISKCIISKDAVLGTGKPYVIRNRGVVGMNAS